MSRRVCAWNEATLSFDRNCRFLPACDGDAGSIDPSDGVADTATPAAFAPLLPTTWPMNASPLPHVVDPGDHGQGDGWDTCHGPFRVFGGPRQGTGDPTPREGLGYIVATPGISHSKEPVESAQFAFFFDTLITSRNGLWFFARKISGDAEGAAIELHETQACRMHTRLGRHDMLNVLTDTDWVQTCAPLPDNITLSELGISFVAPEGSDLHLAADGFKLGPVCNDVDPP